MTKRLKVRAWREAGMAVEERAQLVLAWADRYEDAEAISEHMLKVIAPSLRQRAEIIKRRKTRGT